MTEPSPTLDLSHLISAAVAAKMTPDFIGKEVDARVGKLIVDSIDQALRTYSDTGKLIQQTVADALRVDRLDLPTYGSIVTMMLKAQIEATVAPLVAGRLAEDMQELLSLAPKHIKLSAIAEKMLERRRDDGDAWGEVITVEVQRNEHGSAWVYLDEECHYAHRAQYDAKHRILVVKDGTIASAYVGDRPSNNKSYVGRSYCLEQLIRAWVACGTVIELDEDFVSVSIGD